jgi:hypothetical protein
MYESRVEAASANSSQYPRIPQHTHSCRERPLTNPKISIHVEQSTEDRTHPDAPTPPPQDPIVPKVFSFRLRLVLYWSRQS